MELPKTVWQRGAKLDLRKEGKDRQPTPRPSTAKLVQDDSGLLKIPHHDPEQLKLAREGMEQFRSGLRDNLEPPEWREQDPPKKTGGRERVLERIKLAQQKRKTPKVAVSFRGGHGYDQGAFNKGTTHANVLTAPPNFEGLPPKPKQQPELGVWQKQSELQESEVIKARDPNAVNGHLTGAHGLYIPGGQDMTFKNKQEAPSRETYEQALLKRARNLGMPTLAICGGSRVFGRQFGGVEAPSDEKIHNVGLDKQAHGLDLVGHTVLGGTQGGTVDKINSTHKKMVDLSNATKLPATGESEIHVSAKDEQGNPEGFETRYGAPLLGVTSHPEAIHGAASSARDNATVQGKAWSDEVFKGFEQSMHAYAGKQQVNQEIRDKVKKVKRFNK